VSFPQDDSIDFISKNIEGFLSVFRNSYSDDPLVHLLEEA
jgi:hypothetical protein